MNALQPWSAERAMTIVADNRHLRGALLPILHALQEEFGYIDEEAIPLLAAELNLSRADVYGVVSFYHEFRREKPGRHIIKVCRAEACQSMGANALVDHIKKQLQVDFHGTTADGSFTLEQVFCLGNCALSPAVMIDEQLHGRVTPERFDALAAEARTAPHAHPHAHPPGHGAHSHKGHAQ
ncbi:formate dehydrogenase subunit gamma [Azospirillum picis]|uniref:Formate dehydrogenase subunit gamma n=1 Tax=Azospirillum picis TaxID=488438 RepID=A0ABU0MSZ0_9PROT|nr:formate dehydrogenase subunit gamma [Azospirillum picis]MBP2302880.1 formate dehydrogenase subunit gamma [Azospirillum picis]MDQ0536615.1 formate dehydrogenase subunit gamma [Azospirillum picis]